ncbi:MAG TPA: TadE/TadG family type IV pilus assembly protein [Smithella sp.]|nr:TadE/TadG family type IV pilus assembly protein [Smithella sp.]HQJ68840.1 TadE/TadG family type IV pilus assembly protein [Anaerohalosphaeraceae bacterium]
MKKLNERGVSAVEFALILPVLVLILFGIVEFGLILYNQQVITNASREGARAGILFASTRPTEQEIKDVVANYTSDHLVTFQNGTSSNPTVPTGPCTAFGSNLTVTVTYQYTFLMLDNLGFTGPNLTASTTMRCE